MKKIIGTVMILSVLAGCAGTGQDDFFNKQTAGTLLGGAGGAWAGSNIGGGSGKIVATAVGGVLGAIIGSQIGQGLDERDRLLMTNTTYNTLETVPSYEPARWRNPDNGNYGEVVAQPAYQMNNQQCRDFTQTIFVDGQAETARGKACRQSDGTWDIIS